MSKRCFTYCGPEICNCPANDLHSTLEYVEVALPVLETMCRTAGLTGGADKAAEMGREVCAALASKPGGEGDDA